MEKIVRKVFYLLVLIALTTELVNCAACRYYEGVYGYSCELSDATYSSETDTFNITGNHVGKKNDDVVYLSVDPTSVTLTLIPKEIFNTFTRLKNVSLKDAKITKVAGNRIINCDVLTTLSLETNLITDIPASAFFNCPKLQTLLLSSNKIATLGDFGTLGELLELSLSNNLLDPKSIGKQTFSTMPKLKTLNLKSNKFTTLPADLLASSTALENLDLSSNALTAIPENFFAVPVGLKNVNLAGNKLATVESIAALSSLVKLQSLDLSSCGITTIPPKEVSSIFTELMVLNLGDNQITTVDETSFNGLTKLKTLSMNANKITELKPELFKENVALTEINFTGNSITAINSNTFKTLVNLENLYLGMNKIEKIDRYTFVPLKKLKTLDLKSNDCIDKIFSGAELTDLNALTTCYFNYDGGWTTIATTTSSSTNSPYVPVVSAAPNGLLAYHEREREHEVTFVIGQNETEGSLFKRFINRFFPNM